MEFTTTDAILLHAVYNPALTDSGTGLREIIAYHDYIDHSILTYEEFHTSIQKLLKAGLIKQVDQKIMSETLYKVWYAGCFKSGKRFTDQKILKEIKEYLNTSFSVIQQENVSINTTKEEFSKIVKEYAG